jgi:serine/threonine protein kinase
MIDEKWRYWPSGGGVFPGGPSDWYLVDWDQRRTIVVTMDEQQESPDAAIGHLHKHIDALGPDVYAVHISLDGKLISSSTNPEDDQTMCVYYPPLQDIQCPSHIKTVIRSDLLELDRFGPTADLVSYMPSPDAAEPRKAVFKYYFVYQSIERVWHEMNVWMRLPAHPNLVPMDRVVLDELRGRIVGFTSLYIPSGTLEQNCPRVFKLEWLRQLICVVDDLNLKYGMAHQDVAPRNLLINPNTDALMLLDFNSCARIGYDGFVGGTGLEYREEKNDIKGVIFTLYEIITRDTHFRDDAEYSEQNPTDVQELEKWVQHADVELDHPVSEYRAVLNDWVDKRQTERQISHYKEAPEYIEWPEFPKPPPEDLIFRDSKGNITGTVPHVFLFRLRRDERREGKAILEWERPAQAKLKDGDRLLANGQFVSNE